MLKKIHVFDNIINKKHQKIIKDTLFDVNFPWFFAEDVTYTNNKKQSRPAFKHYFVIDRKVNSSFHEHILPIINNSLKKAKINATEILQGRSFFQLPLNLKDRHIVDTPHIDLEFEHIVILYYVLDNEAHTIIYEDKKSLKILKKIKPKQGRVVVFNGKHWHTAEQPINNNRCIINYNLL